jgi:hypothetical protein
MPSTGGHAPALGIVAPARRGEIERFLDDCGQPHRAEGHLGLTRHEVLQPPHGGRGFQGHVPHDHEPPMGRGIRGRVAEEELGIGEDGGQRVVEIVRETAHRLAEGAQVVALLETSPALRDPARQIAGPAPQGEDGTVDLHLGARHLARDVLDLLVVREEKRILGDGRLRGPADPFVEPFPDPSHSRLSRCPGETG